MKDISDPLLRPRFQWQPNPHDPSNILELIAPAVGTAAVTEGADTLSATGTVTSGAGTITGSASITESADTITATATHPVVGTLTKTEGADTISAAGTHPVTGSLTKTESADTIAATATHPVIGSATVTEGADTISADGTVIAAGGVVGSATITEAADTVGATGTVEGGTVVVETPRAGGVGSGQKGRVIQRFYADEGVAEETSFSSQDTPTKKPKRRAVVRAIERFVAAEIANAPEVPALTDLLRRVEQEAQYRAFLNERAVNQRRIEALIAAMIEEAENDDEEAVMLLLAA